MLLYFTKSEIKKLLKNICFKYSQDRLPEPEKDVVQEYKVFLPNPFQEGNHNGFDQNKQMPLTDPC